MLCVVVVVRGSLPRRVQLHLENEYVILTFSPLRYESFAHLVVFPLRERERRRRITTTTTATLPRQYPPPANTHLRQSHTKSQFSCFGICPRRAICILYPIPDCFCDLRERRWVGKRQFELGSLRCLRTQPPSPYSRPVVLYLGNFCCCNNRVVRFTRELRS